MGFKKTGSGTSLGTIEIPPEPKPKDDQSDKDEAK